MSLWCQFGVILMSFWRLFCVSLVSFHLDPLINYSNLNFNLCHFWHHFDVILMSFHLDPLITWSNQNFMSSISMLSDEMATSIMPLMYLNTWLAQVKLSEYLTGLTKQIEHVIDSLVSRCLLITADFILFIGFPLRGCVRIIRKGLLAIVGILSGFFQDSFGILS